MNGIAAAMAAGLLLGVAPLAACKEDPPPPPKVWANAATQSPGRQPPTVLRPRSHDDLTGFFARRNYDWETLDQGVPPFILESLPEDLNQVARTDRRKRIFFLSMLPMVLLANQEIEEQRADLLRLLEAYDLIGEISPQQERFLAELLKTYEVSGDPRADHRVQRQLLRRVDIVPVSLALAQAATESAYGTSRFARRGNNLFGEWTFVPGTGLVPRERPEGATYEVRRFDNVYASLQSYLNNINTHPAYRELRHKRARLRKLGQPLSGLALAGGLQRYSSRGQAYVRDLRNIIRHNDLFKLADTWLRSGDPELDARPHPAAGLLSSAPFSSRSPDGRERTTAD